MNIAQLFPDCRIDLHRVTLAPAPGRCPGYLRHIPGWDATLLNDSDYSIRIILV